MLTIIKSYNSLMRTNCKYVYPLCVLMLISYTIMYTVCDIHTLSNHSSLKGRKITTNVQL